MSITRWTPHTIARMAAAGVTLLAMSALLGAESESSASVQAANATTTYSCSSSSGELKVPARITGDFPSTGAVGSPVRPVAVTLTVTLPPPALADLTKLEATSVAASTRLSVKVAQHSGITDASWPGTTARPAPLPETGDLSLTTSATVPPATVTSIGGMTFLAGALTLTLTPFKADGTATSPATVPFDCTPGVPAVIATVSVPGPGVPVTPRHHSAKVPSPHSTSRSPADDDPCILETDLPPVAAEAYLAGFSNVDKLHGATLLGVENGETAGHTTLELAYHLILNACTGDVHFLSRGLLDDEDHQHRLPPAKATFLTFDFMPVTAVLDLTQPPGTALEIDSHNYNNEAGENFEDTTVRSRLSLRLHDVSVNGVPLDVGPRCESVTPMDLTMFGKMPDYTVNTGGTLTGTATIPRFTGCGAREDLDPLFSASISGPDNFMKLTQGRPCVPTNEPPDDHCPPERPLPRP